jgi:hypothetical protein
VLGHTRSSDFPLKNPAQDTFGGEIGVFVTAIDNGGGSPVPGSIGNNLFVVKVKLAGAIVFTWSDIPVATGYQLFRHEVKSDPAWASDASALTGSPPGLSIPTPVEPLRFYKIAAPNCGIAGPT